MGTANNIEPRISQPTMAETGWIAVSDGNSIQAVAFCFDNAPPHLP